MVKTFVFAVHALSYEKMLEKIQEGCMPNLKRLKQKGSYGVCKSVFSTASAVDYVSLLTGTTPTTHGIDDFQTNTLQGSTFGRDPEDYRMQRIPPNQLENSRVYTSEDVKVPWVWSLLYEHKSMQFGIFSPATYPAPELPNNGVWISGYWNNPRKLIDSKEAANNQRVREKILDEYQDYPLTPELAIPPTYPEVESEFDYLQAKLEIDKKMSNKIQEARLNVMKTEDWDIFLTEEFFCDNIQHLLWPRDSSNKHYNETDRKLEEKDLLGKYYKHIDNLLGKYMEKLPEDSNIIIISAHGQKESKNNEGMHEQFYKLFENEIWVSPKGWKFESDKPFEIPSRADHDKNGAFVMKGPDFRNSDEPKKISCMDFTPLLLEIYDYEKPEHLDGTTPKGIVK